MTYFTSELTQQQASAITSQAWIACWGGLGLEAALHTATVRGKQFQSRSQDVVFLLTFTFALPSFSSLLSKAEAVVDT